MKSSLRKLRVALHRSDHNKERRQPHAPAHQDELLQAAQDMLDMKSCYDSLLSAAAATANSAYEFSEALREMGTCLLEKTALNDDEEIDRVLLMLGKAQFELQKLVDSYRVHVIQTITTPSESLLKELQTVEEMKRQCDDKKELYKTMLAAQKEKGKLRHAKGETFSSQQLQAAKEDYHEEATLFAFRLKSLKQGQSRSLLTQAARHHAAQLNFFRKGVRSLEVLEPHVKIVSEQQRIDYHFSGLEDDDTEDDDEDSEDEDSFDGSDDGELSFDYGQHDRGQDVGSVTRNSMEMDIRKGEVGWVWKEESGETELDREDQMNLPTSTAENAQENVDRSQADFLSFIRAPEAGSQSAPILPDKKFEPHERMKQLRPSSTRKYHTYVLPTPGDVKSSALTGSGVSVSASQLGSKGCLSTPLWHSSPLQPGMHVKDFRDDDLTRFPKSQSVLKESNINSGPIRMPPPLSEGLSLPKYNLSNASGTKKNRRQAFSGPLTSKEYSGPLTSKAYSSKPTFSATDSMSSLEHLPALSAKPTGIPTPQPSMSQKVSPSASPPPMSSPRINELHELPRPPVSSAKPTRPTSLIGHSAPLAPRGQEYYATSRASSNASHTASPLPTPPGGMTRSFSIPSSGQRTAKLTVAKLLENPSNQGKTLEISSPRLMLVSVTNAQSVLVDPESVSPPAKTEGNL